MPDARLFREDDETIVAVEASVSVGEVWQLPTGEAAYMDAATAQSTNARVKFRTAGKCTITKTTGVVILRGGKVYWDHSANSATYKKVNDRDFYIGRAVGDAASLDATVEVDLNKNPPYDIDLMRDAYRSALIGTVSATGCNIFRRGGALNFVHSSTNEAQKLDALSVDGWVASTGAANAIVEFAFTVVSDGSGTAVDVNIGAANGTHATDFESVTEFVGIHLDANNVNINAQSRDGVSSAVTATDTTLDYTEGAGIANRVEVWLDMRDPSDVQIYVNGANVLPSSVFDVDGATGPWRLICHSEKTSAADTYEFDLEFMRVRFMEQ